MKATSPDSSNPDRLVSKAHARARRRTASRRRHLARTRAAVAASVVALGIGGGIAGTALATVMKNPDSTAAGPVNKLAPQVNPRTLTGEAFALAAAGDCLNWRGSDGGLPTDIYAVDCTTPHRFEVAKRLDLAGATDNDTPPRGATNVDLARRLCTPAVNEYAGDHPLDPEGRFAVALIPPSQQGWEAGDRSGLCGIAAKELSGGSAESLGPFNSADQHRLWDPGTCLGISEQRVPTAPVDCAGDHSIEIAATVSVADLFPEGPEPPEAAKQTELTAKACYDAAVQYVGDAEALRRTTLFAALVQPISTGSWTTGSRTVNCGLMRTADPGPFAVLQGSAVSGVRIEGAAPQVPTTTVVPPPPAPSTNAVPPADAAPSGVPLQGTSPSNGPSGEANASGLGIGPAPGDGGPGGVGPQGAAPGGQGAQPGEPGGVPGGAPGGAPGGLPAVPPPPPNPGIDLGGLFPGNAAPNAAPNPVPNAAP